jgi:hypothetical protein
LNVRGRSFRSPPIVGDVESFSLLDAEGKLHTCSCAANEELLSLANGGYGLFGLITHVLLRVVRRFKVRRNLKRIAIKDLLDWYQRRLAAGFVFGDCQYSGDVTGQAEGS